MHFLFCYDPPAGALSATDECTGDTRNEILPELRTSQEMGDKPPMSFDNVSQEMGDGSSVVQSQVIQKCRNWALESLAQSSIARKSTRRAPESPRGPTPRQQVKRAPETFFSGLSCCWHQLDFVQLMQPSTRNVACCNECPLGGRCKSKNEIQQNKTSTKNVN